MYIYITVPSHPYLIHYVNCCESQAHDRRSRKKWDENEEEASSNNYIYNRVNKCKKQCDRGSYILHCSAGFVLYVHLQATFCQPLMSGEGGGGGGQQSCSLFCFDALAMDAEGRLYWIQQWVRVLFNASCTKWYIVLVMSLAWTKPLSNGLRASPNKTTQRLIETAC